MEVEIQGRWRGHEERPVSVRVWATQSKIIFPFRFFTLLHVNRSICRDRAYFLKRLARLRLRPLAVSEFPDLAAAPSCCLEPSQGAMLRRHTCRIAHRAEFGDVTKSLCPEFDAFDIEFEFPKTSSKQLRFRIPSRLSVGRIRLRVLSLQRLVGKIKSCGRLLLRKMCRREGATRGLKQRQSGMGRYSYCNHSSYQPDAIADCIEFIKHQQKQNINSSMACGK